MDWLWIILRYLFPLDPVRQCIAALCDRVNVMVQLILDDDALDDLAADPEARIALEAALIDYEATLRLTISARAHQIAKLRFVPGKKAFHRPTRARSLIDLIKRIRVLALGCTDIERLAQLQAARLKREREADPLKLGETSPRRHAAAQRATSSACGEGGPSSTGKAGGGGLRALARKTEGAARYNGTARASPVFDVFLQPQHASEARLLRSHPHAKSKKARCFHRAFFIQSIKWPTRGSTPGRDSAQPRPARPRSAAAGCTWQAGQTARAIPS